MAYLVLEKHMRHEDVLELTPAQIWWYFDKAHQLNAQSRMEVVADLTAAAAPAQFKDGMKYHQDHLKALKAAAGLSAPYTSEQPTN